MTRSLALAGVALAVWSVGAAAHQTVVSQYTFNKDVRPILDARCGRCHVDSGTASPLQRYADVKARSWKIQQELLSGRMPPWYAEAGAVAFTRSEALTPHDFDVLMTWAAGGTPEGSGTARTAKPPIGESAPIPSPQRREIDVTVDGAAIPQRVSIVALRPVSGPDDAVVSLAVVNASGARTELGRLRLRERWMRRYEFAAPLAIEAGSTIEMIQTPSGFSVWATLTGDRPAPATAANPLRIALEVTD